jgi:hypothetical protein
MVVHHPSFKKYVDGPIAPHNWLASSHLDSPGAAELFAGGPSCFSRALRTNRAVWQNTLYRKNVEKTQ